MLALDSYCCAKAITFAKRVRVARGVHGADGGRLFLACAPGSATGVFCAAAPVKRHETPRRHFIPGKNVKIRELPSKWFIRGAMRTTIQEKLERCTSLPTLPAVAVQVLELCQKDDLNQIAAVVGRDPALATKLLKTANSPMFSVRREVTTISHAIDLLGTNAVRTLVLSFSLVKITKTTANTKLSGFWRRSLLSAVAARQLAAACRVNGDEAFLAGLLQDVGVLALLRASAEYGPILEQAQTDHDRLAELEQSAFGTDHAEVGAWLLERWHAPRLLSEAIGASHGAAQETVVPCQEKPKLGCVVALAGRFADLWMGDPQSARSRLSALVEARWAGTVNIESVIAQLVEHAPQLAALFEVTLSADEMNQILEQAQEVQVALSVRSFQEVQNIHEALLRLESRTAALLVEAQRDPLTGVANRGYTDTYFGEVFCAAVKSQRTVGAIFADVDHFKQINDNYGHAAGDAVLQSVSRCITSGIRAGDFVGRYGGEEFVIIVRADSADEIAAVAERIRRNIADKGHSIGNGRVIAVTISLGSALLNTSRHESPAALLSEADDALYAAKRAGRNRHIASCGLARREPVSLTNAQFCGH